MQPLELSYGRPDKEISEHGKNYKAFMKEVKGEREYLCQYKQA